MKTVDLVAALLVTHVIFGAAVASAADASSGIKSNPARDLARQLNEAFVEVAEEVSPEVVVIEVKVAPAAQFTADDSAGDGSDPMDEFRRYFRGLPPSNQPTDGQGSGVIIRKEGYILTNRHVIENATSITVHLKDGRIFTNAVIRGVDAPSDVAVIKIDADNLPVARLADSSKTRVGEYAIAIGAPFALDYSVTFGHVSAKDRSNIIDDPDRPMTDQSFIQTDANINPGNSGGPLVNIDGEVIGINTLIRGLRTGIGFAIPSNLAKEVADEIIAKGKFTRPWLGIKITSLTDPRYRDLFANVKTGVVVDEVVEDGPSAKSELHSLDVITAVDSKPVTTAQQLKDEIRHKKVGQNVALEVYRVGSDGTNRKVEVSVKPGEWPDTTVVAAVPSPVSSGPFGMRVSALGRRGGRNRGQLPPGVVVTRVDRGGLAAKAGIVIGDLITAVDQKPVPDVKAFEDAQKAADLKMGAVLNLSRGGESRIELLHLPEN